MICIKACTFLTQGVIGGWQLSHFETYAKHRPAPNVFAQDKTQTTIGTIWSKAGAPGAA